MCGLRTEPSDWLGLAQSTRKKKYLRCGADIVKQLKVALQPEYVVLGEGNTEFRETLSAMACSGTTLMCSSVDSPLKSPSSFASRFGLIENQLSRGCRTLFSFSPSDL
jgi:hypothetical protein